MDSSIILSFALSVTPLVALAIALFISQRRSMEKARYWDQRVCDIDRHDFLRTTKEQLAQLGPTASSPRIFLAGYRAALEQHAPHKLAEFDAAWTNDTKEQNW